MIFILSFLLAWNLKAEAPRHWHSALEIADRHEFYKDGESIIKPKDSWQTLFSIVYPDGQLKLHKDCVFFRVPGTAPGELKIKKTLKDKPCDEFLFSAGDKTWSAVKAFDFSTKDDLVVINLTLDKYHSETWKVQILKQAQRPEPKLLMSSAEYKSNKIILLAPAEKIDLSEAQSGLLKDGQVCQEVSDDCQTIQASKCGLCSEGWYEVPTGCPVGPKYCGIQSCGRKNQPACRRGMKYQRVEAKYECRGDSSFAYCSPGLKLQCEGAQAFCR